MKSTTFAGLVAVVLCFVGLSSAWSQTTWSLSGDFSSSNNPNGAWAIGGKDRVGGVPTGTFHLANIPDSGAGYFGWNDGLNSAWKNTSGGTVYGIAPGEISVSSDSTATSTIRWTAPETGTIELSGYFGWGDYGVGNRAVFFNEVALFDYAGLVSYTFSKTFSVTTGDTVDFTVWDGGSGGNTPVEATINIVPEPSSFALLLIGLSAFAMRRKNLKPSSGTRIHKHR